MISITQSEWLQCLQPHVRNFYQDNHVWKSFYTSISEMGKAEHGGVLRKKDYDQYWVSHVNKNSGHSDHLASEECSAWAAITPRDPGPDNTNRSECDTEVQAHGH